MSTSAIRLTPPPAASEKGVHRGANFSATDCAPPREWERYRHTHPAIPQAVPGKMCLGSLLGMTGAEVSINSLPPGGEMPFFHRHRENEEIYFFLDGQGEMQIDGQIFPVTTGSVVRVAPAGERTWRNTGLKPLTFIVFQAREGSLPAAGGGDGEVLARKVSW